MKGPDAVVAGLALVVTLVVVVIIGPIGLVLLTMVFLQIIVMIRGSAPAPKKGGFRVGKQEDNDLLKRNQLEDLVTRVQQDGRRTDWETLIESTRPTLEIFAKYLCRSDQFPFTADDLENDVWEKLLLGGIKKYERGNFNGWLKVVAYRVFLDTLEIAEHRAEKEDGAPTANHDLGKTITVFEALASLPVEDAFLILVKRGFAMHWDEVVKAMDETFPERAWSRTECQRRVKRIESILRGEEKEGGQNA
jgi:DNA-directed RNA polymerase specialized sigma24 family protein